MIIDTLHSAQLYYGLHPYFKEAFEFMADGWDRLEDGVHEIRGREVYVTISTQSMREVECAPLEAHDRYIDIQIVMRGSEGYGFAPRVALGRPNENSDPERDLMFFDDPVPEVLRLHQGQFVVFFPGDAHAPLVGRAIVRKAVIKVAVL